MIHEPTFMSWGLLGLVVLLPIMLRLLVRRKNRPGGLLDYQRKIYGKADAARMGDRDYWQEWR